MYKKDIYTVISNTPLTKDVYRMVLEGDTEWITRPGQFVNIELEGLYLRRPISISDWDERTITIIYKVGTLFSSSNYYYISIIYSFVFKSFF